MTHSNDRTDSNSTVSSGDHVPDLRLSRPNREPDSTRQSSGVNLFGFGILVVAWAGVVAAYLLVAGMLTVERLFIGVFVGHLVLVEVIATNDEDIERHWALRWSVRLGYLLFAYVIYNDILSLVANV